MGFGRVWVPLWSSMSLAWLRSSVSLPSFSDRAGAPTGFALAVEPVSFLRLVDCFAPRLSRLSWCSCGHLGGEPVSLWGSVECFAPELQRLSWCSYEGRPGGRACLSPSFGRVFRSQTFGVELVLLQRSPSWSSLSPACFGRVYRSRASAAELVLPGESPSRGRACLPLVLVECITPKHWQSSWCSCRGSPSGRAYAPTAFRSSVSLPCFYGRVNVPSMVAWAATLGSQPVSHVCLVECVVPEFSGLSWCSCKGLPRSRACLPLA